MPVEAVHFVRSRWPRTPRAGIILGTGLGQLAESIVREAVIPYGEIPHFPRSTALGHRGQLVCGELQGIPLVAFDGRFHFYEGYTTEEITLPIWSLRALGADLLIVSNASGGLNPQYQSGDVMAVADHLDLMGRRTAAPATSAGTPMSPIRSGGPNPYDARLIDQAEQIARRAGFACHRGTYVAVLGPNYETRAEYRALRRLGGDAVGMSTVPEVLAANRCGLRILALSTITNVARPDALTSTEAQQVVDIAATAEPKLRAIIKGVLQRSFPTEDCTGPKWSLPGALA